MITGVRRDDVTVENATVFAREFVLDDGGAALLELVVVAHAKEVDGLADRALAADSLHARARYDRHREQRDLADGVSPDLRLVEFGDERLEGGAAMEHWGLAVLREGHAG